MVQSMESTEMSQPLTDEQIWGESIDETAEPSAPVADDDFCTKRGTHCPFWHATLGCVRDGCIDESE